MFGNLAKKLAKKNGYPVGYVPVNPVLNRGCRCREPKRHRDCSYCGVTAHAPDYVCGACALRGIDGKVIRGTSRVVCAAHKP